MAVVVCCPCGNPISLESLELVVSVDCPACGREFELDMEDGPKTRRRAVFTVLEGPTWVGKEFLVPVNVDLRIGRALGNWLCLDDERVSNVHCQLRLMPQGSAVVEDCKSLNGTWIDDQQVTRSPLRSDQIMRIGGYRFRLAFCNAEDTATAPALSSFTDSSAELLPTMASVSARASLVQRITRDRFVIGRWHLVASAWLIGLYHAVALNQQFGGGWTLPRTGFAGLVAAVVLTASARQFTASKGFLRFLPCLLLAALAVADFLWNLPIAAISELFLAVGLALLAPNAVNAAMVVLGVCVSSIGLGVALVGAIVRLRS